MIFHLKIKSKEKLAFSENGKVIQELDIYKPITKNLSNLTFLI